MRLTDIISPNRIVLDLRAGDKAQALAEIAKRASTLVPVQAPAILTALAAREKLGSTGFGNGFALPHVRIPGLDSLFGLLVRLTKPIDYEAIDGSPVDILFLLLIPADNGNDHIAALAAVSRVMRDDANLTAVRKASNAILLFNALAASEA
jgi:PTS system nitrogen regulatory IIA component